MNKRILPWSLVLMLSLELTLPSLIPSANAQPTEAEIRQAVQYRQAKERLKTIQLGPLVGAGFMLSAGALVYQAGFSPELTGIATSCGIGILMPSLQKAKSEIMTIAQKYYSNGTTQITDASQPGGQLLLIESLEEEIEVKANIPEALTTSHIQTLRDMILEAKSALLKPWMDEKKLKLLSSTLSAILQFPTNVIQVQHPDAAYTQMAEHLRTYDPSIQQGIQLMLENIIERSFADATSHAPIGRAFLFHGEPGTGKTVTALAVAQSLGLPYCRISLSKMGPEKFFGVVPDHSHESAKDVWSAIAQCMAEPQVGKPSKNPIILIDEAHYALNDPNPTGRKFLAQFQELLEPSTKSLDDAGLRVSIDISGVTFIINTNEPLKSVKGALNRRVIPIQFPPTSAESKKIIAEQTFQQIAREKRYTPQEGDTDELERILEADKKQLGAGILQQVIGQYVSYLNLLKAERITGPFDAAQHVRNMIHEETPSADDLIENAVAPSALHSDISFIQEQIAYHEQKATFHHEHVQKFKRTARILQQNGHTQSSNDPQLDSKI